MTTTKQEQGSETRAILPTIADVVFVDGDDMPDVWPLVGPWGVAMSGISDRALSDSNGRAVVMTLDHFTALMDAASLPASGDRSPEPTDADVAAVETAVGMGHGAWDTIDPEEIIAAAWKLRPASSGSAAPEGERTVQVFNVADFGASPDASGEVNSFAFQRACDAATSAQRDGADPLLAKLRNAVVGPKGNRTDYIAMLSTADATEILRRLSLAAESESYIAALRGPLLHYWGTTDPALLAEVWADAAAASSQESGDRERHPDSERLDWLEKYANPAHCSVPGYNPARVRELVSGTVHEADTLREAIDAARATSPESDQ